MYRVHMADLGLTEMRLYPELVPTLVWISLHVLMNMLFFLIVRASTCLLRNLTSPSVCKLATGWP